MNCHFNIYQLAGRTAAAVLTVLGVGLSMPSCTELASEQAVEFAGCDAVWRGPACAPSSTKPFSLWIPDAVDAHVSVTVDHKVVVASATEVQAGIRYEVDIPREARRLDVAVRRGTQLARWSLVLRPDREIPALTQAGKLRRKGQPRKAITQLRGAVRNADPSTHGRYWSLLARLQFDAGNAERGFELLRRSVRHHRRTGRVHEAIWDGNMLAFKLSKMRGAHHEARAVLDDLSGELELLPEGRATMTYTRGIIFRDTGDYRNAIEHFSAAMDGARRLGRQSLARDFAQAHAATFAELGRVAEARAWLDALRQEIDASVDLDASPGAAVRVLNNLCWARVLADDAAMGPLCPHEGEVGPGVRSTARVCESALKALLRTDGFTTDQQANLTVNDAVAALHVGDLEKSRRQIEAAYALLPEPPVYIAGWLEDTRGRLQLCSDRPNDALETYLQLEKQEREQDAPSGRWRAAIGRGRALEALDRSDEAIAAYVEAERLLSQQSIDVPLGAGRGSFLGDRQLSARMLVDLLVNLDRPAEALAAARRSQQRLLVSLWRSFQLSTLTEPQRRQRERAIKAYQGERAAIARRSKNIATLPDDLREARIAEVDGRMAAARKALEATLATLPQVVTMTDDALVMPVAGELMLGYHPTAEGDWVGFAATAGGVVARRIAAPTSSEPAIVSEALLAPFEASIDQATHITILPYGTLPTIVPHDGQPARLDIHALPWPPSSGEPLVEHVPLAYRLDVPMASAPRVPSGTTGTTPIALVVADPASNLLNARGDGEKVRAALSNLAGWQPTLLQGPDASSDAVSAALASADFFHFSGHGYAAGHDGWQSTLQLAAGGRLALTDVLALSSVPRQVVLSSCEGAGEVGGFRGEQLGLAQAFVIRGADYAIATLGDVSDEDASHMARAIYRHVAGSGLVDPAAALRAAQQDVRRAHPTVDWASYRIIMR